MNANDGARLHKIGEVADATSLSIKTLRHYDEIELVSPSARSHGGFRLYTEDDIDRLLLIRRMKPLGFSLAEMKQVLEAIAAGPEGADFLAAVHDRAVETQRDLRRKLDYAVEFTALIATRAADQRG